MDSLVGIIYGLIAGVLGGLFVIFIWAIVGILKGPILGCPAGFITFVLIEFPAWVGVPVMVAERLAVSAPNLTALKAALIVYVLALIGLLSADAVTKVRANVFRK